MKFTFSYLLTVLALLPFTPAQSQSKNEIPPELLQGIEKAYETEDYDKVIELTENVAKEKDGRLVMARAAAFQRRGEERFFASDIKGSIADFDQYLKIVQEQEPHHWQRGLAYYYAGEYEKGVAQFEQHQTVNSQDVENAVWHFLCVVRAPGGDFEKAQSKLIPIEGDSRIPMKEVHNLFAGKGTVEQVLEAAGGPVEEGKEVTGRDRNHLCYAHLYLALYYETKGEDAKVKEHIDLAANRFRMDHYMGKTAQVHAKLRGVELK